MPNISGIINKLEDKADWVAALASIYSRFGGDLSQAFNWYSQNALNDLLNVTLTNPAMIKYKLLDSSHAYTSLFKISLLGWFAGEFGVIPKRYQDLAIKVMKGSGIAALTLPGSGPSGPSTYSESSNYRPEMSYGGK